MEKTEKVITTYNERSLHAELKRRFCPDESGHEVKIGRFVADACTGDKIYEVQTGNLAPLAKKIRFYLENTDMEIVVVRPIAQKRRIFWLDKETGEQVKPARLSPRHENIFSGIADLFYLKELLGEYRLSFCFVMMEIDEVRFLDGYGKNKKIRATSADRVAGEIFDEIVVSGESGVRDIVLPALPNEEFSRDELAKALGVSGLKLWSLQKLITELEIVRCEREGKRLVFRKKDILRLNTQN